MHDEILNRWQRWVLIGATTLLLTLIWYVFAWHVDLRIAVNGYSGVAWAYKHLHPQFFLHDFYSGMSEYTVSWFMYIYLLFAKFHVDPTWATRLEILLSMIMLVIAYLHLTQTISKKSELTTKIIILLLAFSSYAMNINLGRWGAPVYFGLYYNAADCFRLLSVSYWLRNRKATAIIWMIPAVITHPTMALYAIIFIAAMQVTRLKALFQWRVILAAIGFLAVAFTWFHYTLPHASISDSGIPLAMWMKINKLTSYHWFPVNFGVFGIWYAAPFFAYLCFNLLLVYALSARTSSVIHYKKQLIAGFIGINIAAALGVLLAYLAFSPFMVKLALQRASGMLIRVGLICLVLTLWQEFKQGGLFRKVINSTALCAPFISLMPYPLLFNLLIVSPAFTKGHKLKRTIVAFSVFLVALAGLYVVLGFGDGMGSLAKVNQFSLPYTGGGLLLTWLGILFVLLSVLTFFSKKISYRKFIITVILIGFACFWAWQQRLPAQQFEFARNYKAVQVWARDNTKVGSVFMVDPEIFYGWRAYSQRPSVGNVRDWLTAWLYTNNSQAYRQGLALINEFDIDAVSYINQYYNKIGGGYKLYDKVRQQYYQLGDKWRAMMASKYHINYMVLKKKYVKTPSHYPIVYQNADFEVIALTTNAKR